MRAGVARVAALTAHRVTYFRTENRLLIEKLSLNAPMTVNRLHFRTSMAGSSAREIAVVTWTQDEKSPFYCVEPWMGPPNAHETKVGLHSVAPGQTQKFYTEISIG